MAKGNIERFFDAVMTDKTLAGKAAALAAEQGYGFTVEELLESGAAYPLFDNNLENIHGGMKPFIPTPQKNPPGPGKKPVT